MENNSATAVQDHSAEVRSSRIFPDDAWIVNIPAILNLSNLSE